MSMMSHIEFSPEKKRIKTVRSFGLICFRKDQNDKYFVLLVRRRISYEFSEIMNCKYKLDELPSAIFHRLPTYERILLTTLSFQQLWFYQTLNCNFVDKDYIRKKEQFEQTYLKDGGQKLLARLKEVHSSINNEIWSPPHGRRKIYGKNKVETDLECSVREFQEETGIDKKFLKIYPSIVRTLSFEDCGIRYIEKFYLAITLQNNIMPRMYISQSDLIQPQEIIEARWVGLENISEICRKEIRASSHFNGVIHALYHSLIRNTISSRLPKVRKNRFIHKKSVNIIRRVEHQ